MTIFSDFLSTADGPVFDTFGVIGSYTDLAGSTTDNFGIVLGDIAVDEVIDEVGRCFLYEVEAVIKKADIASPAAAINGTLTINSIVWQIVGVVSEDETAATYRLDRRDDKRRHSENKYIR